MSDPYFSSVVSLYHFDGTSSRRFVDYADNAVFPELAATGVAITSVQKKFGESSAFFNGGYIWMGTVGDPKFVPGAGQDFCVESWCFDVGSGNRRVLFGNSENGGGGGSLSILLTTSNTFSIGVTIGGTQYLIQPVTSTPLNTWYHLALVRYGTTLTLYLNGTSIGSVTVPTGAVNIPTGKFAIGSAGLYLGYSGTYGVQWMGYLDEFRFTIGNARYTGNFTPPIAAFDPNYPLPPLTASRWNLGPYLSYGDRLPQSPLSASQIGRLTRYEVQTSGNGRIAGKVTIENIPGSRKVRLYRKADGMLIRETWSASNGDYSFEGIDPNWEYFVVSHDHLRVHNAVVSDMIDPP